MKTALKFIKERLVRQAPDLPDRLLRPCHMMSAIKWIESAIINLHVLIQDLAYERILLVHTHVVF